MALFHSQLFKPLPALQQDVKCFWTIEAEATTHNATPILPDTNIELIVNCGAPFTYAEPDGTLTQLPRVFLSKLHNRPQYSHVAGELAFVAVRLYPWAVRNFVDLSGTSTDAPYLPLSHRWQDFAITVESTFRQRGYQAAVDSLQEIVVAARHPQRYADPIQSAGATLDDLGGQVDMPTLAARSHLSLRQFERQFKYWTGILPKAYARLIRHETVRAAIRRDPCRSMSALALDHGYTDQAHFIHEFKAYTGITPNTFASYYRPATA